MASKGMKIGIVSLWLLILLSERPMYGYEIKRELEKRFAGYWKPKTGTIYPALEKLEQGGLVTSSMEFRDEGIDRKNYALARRGSEELARNMPYWAKMFEMLETYRTAHQAITKFERQVSKSELSNLLAEIQNLTPPGKKLSLELREPLVFKVQYWKQNEKREVHFEIEWMVNEAKKN